MMMMMVVVVVIVVLRQHRTVVERWSVTGELSRSYAQPAADG